MRPLPNLRQLGYLVALADEVHFGRAAQACAVTQSTLSAGIRELEALLGVALAERTKRSVLITPVGRRITERARVLLRDAEALVALGASMAQPLSGELALGVITPPRDARRSTCSRTGTASPAATTTGSPPRTA